MAVMLLPMWPIAFRTRVVGIGLVLGGLNCVGSAFVRSRRSRLGPSRRPWMIFACAGGIAILGNSWVMVGGQDPLSSPGVISNAAIAVALVISTVGLATFPGTLPRGPELVLMFIDGLIAGGALLLIVSDLVYAQLLNSSIQLGLAAQLSTLVFPVLDVLLATVAILLVLRSSRAERLKLGLVSSGFLLYAFSDLAYAARSAHGSFDFGSMLDLGWVAGYLVLSLAAWVPQGDARRGRSEGAGLSDSVGTMLVFAVLLVAAAVQIGFGGSGTPHGAQAAAWIVLIFAAGVRQVMLTADNAGCATASSAGRRADRRPAPPGATERAAADSVGDGIYGVDRDRRVTFVNSLGARLARAARRASCDGRGAHELFLARRPAGPGTRDRLLPARGDHRRRGRRGPRTTSTCAPTAAVSRSRSPPPRCSTTTRSAAPSSSSATSPSVARSTG